jgi:hypothetical protein
VKPGLLLSIYGSELQNKTARKIFYRGHPIVLLNLNRWISVKHDNVIVIYKMTIYFGLRHHHQAIATRILKITCIAVQIKLLMWDPM